MSVTRQDWVKALESGNYKPGQGKLRSLEDEFCPLGVLADLLVRQKLLGLSWVKGPESYILKSETQEIDVELPNVVRVSTGIATSQWHVIRSHDGRVAELARYNNLERAGDGKPKRPFQDVLEMLKKDSENKPERRGVPDFVIAF